MSDAMNFAELAGQHVELLPARTVLSLLQAAPDGTAGAPGTPGAHGSSINGQDAAGTNTSPHVDNASPPVDNASPPVDSPSDTGEASSTAN